MKISVECLNDQHIQKYADAGATCLIVSLPEVSLRSSQILSESQVIKAVQTCHELKMEVAMNMMSFVEEEKIERFEKTLLFCKQNHIDAIYFSDMGIYQMAKEIGIENRLIYQPNTLLTSSDDAQCYLDLGLRRVVLSREITFEDLKSILSKVSSCEVIVFGYNVMMHSRRKLLSSYFEFTHQKDISDSTSLFLMEENRDEKMPIFQDEHGTHVLSGNIFCFYKELKELHCDFKIEGYGLDEPIVLQAIRDVDSILKGMDGEELFEKRKQELKSSDGFMYKKTSLVKEECA